MNKGIIVSIAILATGFILFSSNRAFEAERSVIISRDLSRYIPTTLPLRFNIPVNDETLSQEAWTTFQNYLEFARTYNLPGVRSLSHQLSDACNDQSREEECFALMDSVYTFANQLELSEFKHVQMDERQIIMFTDGPVVAILYFTRDESGAPKVLGLRFCLEDESVQEKCVETDSIKNDEDGDGWWDSVESLFYD